MITVTLTLFNKVSNFNFGTLTEALVFARRSEIGTSFVIKEKNTLLARGKIFNVKGFDYE